MKLSPLEQQEFGEYLARARCKAGLSQGDVSNHFGFTTPQFISNIERGMCPCPLDVLADFITLYDMSESRALIEPTSLMRSSIRGQVQAYRSTK